MWFDTTTTAGSEDVRVVGPTSLESVDCRRFEAKGATEVAGDVSADVAVCKGATSIDGSVSVDTFESKGATDVGGSLDADGATFEGSARVVGPTQVDDLYAKGAAQFAVVDCDAFEAKGQVAADTVTADEIRIHGVVSAERLDAETVTLRLEGERSTVGTIVAEAVTVERGDGDGEWANERGRLEATTIEGESVAVEYAEVETIVGRKVDVGPGSHVGLVRADDISVHPDATVERTESLE